MEKQIVKLSSGDERHKNWAKVLSGVDRGVSNGYAFLGEWIPMGQMVEVPIGSLILIYRGEGSMKNWSSTICLLRVIPGEKATEVVFSEKGLDQRGWALSVRDKIADLMEAPQKTESKIEKILRLVSELSETERQELIERGVLPRR